MSRKATIRGLYIAIAVTVAILIQRERLAIIVSDFINSFERQGVTHRTWAGAAYDFIDNQWALSLSALVVVYFAYRLTVTTREDSN